MLSASLLLSFLVASASARCLDKYYGTADCLTQCQSKMGYPGMMIGRGAWDVVISPTDSSQWTALVSQACGLSGSVASGSSSSPSSISTTSAPSTTSLSANSSAPSSSGDTTNGSTFTTSAANGPSTSSSQKKNSVSTTNFTTTSTSKSSDPTPPSSSSSRTVTTGAPTKSPLSSNSGLSSSVSGDTSNNNKDIQTYLAAHNTIRAVHNAKNLTWSDSLASSAQQWANGCAFKHSTVGENLAAGVGNGYDITAAVKSWTDEVKSYDPNNPQPSHFTQVVWKSTSQLGCGQQMCNGIFDPSLGKVLYVVCHYSAAGNVDGQYTENVQV